MELLAMEDPTVEAIEQIGKLAVRTRVIDVDRDKNNFISEIHSLAHFLEEQIKEEIVNSGETEDKEETRARVVLTVSLPASAREFSTGLDALRRIDMRATFKTNRATVTPTISTLSAVGGNENNEIKSELPL